MKETDKIHPADKGEEELLHNVRHILQEARAKVIHHVNSTLVRAYWQVGKYRAVAPSCRALFHVSPRFSMTPDSRDKTFYRESDVLRFIERNFSNFRKLKKDRPAGSG